MVRSWWSPALVVAMLAAACNTAELTHAPAPAATGDAPIGAGDEAGRKNDPLAPDGGDPEPGAPPFAMSRSVTIQVQPSDSGAALLAAIKGAKTSVHMTMYLLSNNDVIKALVSSKRAGKDVKVVLNKTFPPGGGDNTDAYDALKMAGVAVAWAPSAYTFTHAKTIVLDSEKVVIMTMNLTYTSARTNREYIATDTDPDDVAAAEALFAADFSNKAVKVDSKLVVSPANANTLEPREHLERLIASAKTSLDVEVQTLSDTSVVDAILRAHQAKVDVRVVLSGETNETPAQATAVAKLKAGGVPLRALNTPDLHAKCIVVDGKVVFIGSQNMTSTALTQNREIGVITDAEAEAAKVRDVIAADFAKAKPL